VPDAGKLRALCARAERERPVVAQVPTPAVDHDQPHDALGHRSERQRDRPAEVVNDEEKRVSHRPSINSLDTSSCA